MIRYKTVFNGANVFDSDLFLYNSQIIIGSVWYIRIRYLANQVYMQNVQKLPCQTLPPDSIVKSNITTLYKHVTDFLF